MSTTYHVNKTVKTPKQWKVLQGRIVSLTITDLINRQCDQKCYGHQFCPFFVCNSLSVYHRFIIQHSL